MKRTINAVLSTLPFGPEIDRKVEEAFAPAKVYHVDGRDDSGIAAVIQKVEVAVLPSDLDDRILAGGNLKWIHCCHAGLTKSARPEVFERGILLTGGGGRAAPALAEHVFFFAFALAYRTELLRTQRERHAWDEMARTLDGAGCLYGKTIGIVGLGHMGQAAADRAKAFGMRVLAYSRSPRAELPPSVDRFYCYDRGDAVDSMLPECDFVALCCYLSDETYHMIGREQLAMMKPTAYLINMARGAVVDEEALCEALTNGTIAGAGSDVFEEEPLPPSSPLWTIPNLIITPHFTPKAENFAEDSIKVLLENLERYRRGEPLKNQMKPRDILTKRKLY